jgi:small-conductance mechanosensitive channel
LKGGQSLPHEELNRVIKERDRISEERDNLYAEVQQLRAEGNELLARYESEKREIRNYMMKQDQGLQNALNAYEHQKKYTQAILSKVNQRSLVLKDQSIVTMDKLISTSPSFKWENMFEDVENLLTGKSQGAQLPSPWTGLQAPWPADPQIPPVDWDKDEFLERLQRHFASSIGPLDSQRAPEPEMDKDERPELAPQPEPYSSCVDLDGRPLPPGWTNEEHVCGPIFACDPLYFLQAITRRPFLKQSMWRAT